MKKRHAAVLSLFLFVLLISGCSGEVEKFERGEGDEGEGEPCVTDIDCDEVGEVCSEGICIYEENL